MAGIPLIYEIGAEIGPQLKRAVRGVESEMKASNSRIAAETRRASTARMTSDPMARQAARGFDQIGRAARAADAKIIRERMAGDKKASAERLKQIAAEERAALRAAEKVAATQERASRRMASGVAKTVGGSVKKVAGIGANALALGGGLLGGMAATGAIESEIEIRARASQLANQARRPELKAQLAKESKTVKGATGMEALGAMGSFLDITGDLDMARKLLPSLGQLALATGADIGELGATAGNAFIPIIDGLKNVEDPAEKSRLALEQMQDVMAALAGQGAVGAVEIKDLAKEFAGLAATSNRFAGKKGDVLKMMGAMAQAARQRGGASSAAEAVTSVERFASDLVTKSASGGRHTGAQAARMAGIDVFADNGKTQLKNPEEIIIDVLKKTGGDLTKVGGIFGARSIRAFMGFAPLFTQAEARKKGTGEAAVRDEFKRLMGAQFSTEDIRRGAASRLGDEDIRIKEAVKNFNDAVGSKLLPVVTELIPKFTELLPKMTDFAGAIADVAQFLINNPFLGIGALVGGTIVKDLIGAGIGAMVESTLASILAGAAARGGVLSAAAGGVEAAGGALAAKVGIGAGAATLGLAGAGAAVGVGAALYEALGLKGDIEKSGTGDKEGTLADVWKLIKEGPARASTREEYDRLHPPQNLAKPAPGQAPTQGTALDGQKIGRDIGNAAGDAIAAKIAAASVAQNAPNDRRTNPILSR